MDSKTYWAKREEEALKHYITDEKAYDREIKRIYSDMLDSCQKEINAFYGKYADKEGITLAEAKKRVSKLDIAAYERKAKRYVKDKDFSKKANEEMRLYNAAMKINRLELLKANIGLEMIAGHDELEKFMSGILKGRTEEELKRQAGILGKTITNNAQLAHTIPNASFHNATFSDRIWMYQDLMKADLSKLLQSGLIQGKNPRELARTLKKNFDVSTFNAERLMRTELARVQTEAQKQSFEKNGFTQYMFITNGGCCDICKAIDGKIFKVEKMMPGENAAPMHPHCRCSVAAHENSEEYEEWLEFLANGGTTEEYNKLKAQGVTSTKAAKHNGREIKSREEALQALKDMGFDVDTKSDYSLLDEKLFIENVKQLQVLEQRFGAIKGGKTKFSLDADEFPERAIASIRTNWNKDRVSYSKEMILNPELYKDAKTFIEIHTGSTKRGYAMPCADSKHGVYTVIHEYGHLLQDRIILKEYDMVLSKYIEKAAKADEYLKQAQDFKTPRTGEERMQIFENWQKHKKEATNIQYQLEGMKRNESKAKAMNDEIRHIAKELMREEDDYFKDVPDEQMSLAGYMSGYGQSSEFEFFAEAFANALCGEPNIVGQATEIWLKRQGW